MQERRGEGICEIRSELRMTPLQMKGTAKQKQV
jgi:hypothetical protein